MPAIVYQLAVAPLALMYGTLAQVRRDCEVSKAAAHLLTSAQAPIVLLPKRAGQSVLAAAIAPQAIPLAHGVDADPRILALGAHLKTAIALSLGTQVMLSQHIGALETPRRSPA